MSPRFRLNNSLKGQHFKLPSAISGLHSQTSHSLPLSFPAVKETAMGRRPEAELAVAPEALKGG